MNGVGIWELDRASLGRKTGQSKEPRPASRVPSPADLSKWYDVLGRLDANPARETMTSLEESGDRAVEFLETRLKPEVVAEAEILALVRNLDSDKFRVRQKAFARGEVLAKIAKKQLREQMEGTQSAEVRQSLARLLAQADDYSISDPERLRCVRAIECLEVIGGGGPAGSSSGSRMAAPPRP